MSQSGAAVRAFLRFMYTGEADATALDAKLQEVLELAALHEQTELTSACEEHCVKATTIKTVVPLLVAAHLHELSRLKKTCVNLIKASKKNMAAMTMLTPFMSLKSSHPLLWKETRAALGLSPDEAEEEAEQKATKRLCLRVGS